MKDKYGRNIDYLRISVTDRCNLRCVYCMPEEGVESIPHQDVLTYEEIMRLANVAATLGITRIRLTGGEPLVRKGIESLVADIKSIPGIEHISITTNGILLPEKFDALVTAGIDAVNISLDTLSEEKFKRITRREGFERVMEAITLCANAGINTKINCVAMKGVNDDEFIAMAELARDLPVCVRFIEFMPVGKNDFEKCVPWQEIKGNLEAEFGAMPEDTERHGNGPAVYFKPLGFKGSIGFISAMTCAFCDKCNRVRLTAEGYLKLCLQYDIGVSLRDIMRAGVTDEELAIAIRSAVMNKPKEHTFNDYEGAEDIEESGMSRIGG